MPSRFVILHHETADGEHWDLMLEHGGVLRTWRLDREPFARSRPPIPARRIADHRLSYLDYEGPISRNRGRVRRVDAGTSEILELSPRRWIVELRDGRLSGRFRLSAHGDGCLEPIPDDAG